MTILIIHRLATIRAAASIYVLEDELIVQSGAWDALAAEPGGRFQALLRAQARANWPAPVAADSGDAVPASADHREQGQAARRRGPHTER